MRQSDILKSQERASGGAFFDTRLTKLADQLERGQLTESRRGRLEKQLEGAFGGLDEFQALRKTTGTGLIDQSELAKLLREIASGSVLRDEEALVDEAREAARVAEGQRETVMNAQKQLKQDIRTLSQLLTDIKDDVSDLVTKQQQNAAEDPD